MIDAEPGALAARCFALVPCAGVGQRAGATGPKQYAPLAGQAVVAHTLAALQAVSELVGTLVVLSPTDTAFETHAPGWASPGRWVARVGGETRAATVTAGLQALRGLGAAEHDWVLVHDAARCLLRPEWVQRLISACQHDAVGGLLALPVADTLKHEGAGEQAGRAQHTVARTSKWAAQTPQMFRLGPLHTALMAAGDAVTDEASALEAQGLAPRLVLGDFENLKVTWPGDFALAERLLRTR